MNGQSGATGPYARAIETPALSLSAPAPEDTERFGAALAPLLRPGDSVLLSGDLGTGKTTLVRGLAKALGVEGPVTSPTFVLVHSYPTKAGFALLHADVWRLEQLQEVIDLALPELLEEGAAAVIEWGERAAPALPADHLHVDIAFGEAGTEEPATPQGTRRLTIYPGGPSWEKRWPELVASAAANSVLT